jgi:hypothetical protein
MQPGALVSVVAKPSDVEIRVVLHEVTINVPRLKEDAVLIIRITLEAIQVTIDIGDLRLIENVFVIVPEALMDEGSEGRLFELGNEVWSHYVRAKKSSPEAAL